MLIIQNFNSLRYLVLEISSFELGEYRGFCAGASVNTLFLGGVCVEQLGRKMIEKIKLSKM